MQSFANCSELKKCMRTLVHLNMGTLSGPDHIKPIIQFSPCTGQHSFRCTSDCFDGPSQRIAVSCTDV